MAVQQHDRRAGTAVPDPQHHLADVHPVQPKTLEHQTDGTGPTCTRDRTRVWGGMRKLIGRWILLAVAVPLAAAGARRLSDTVEKRRGRTRATRFLRRTAETLDRATGRSTRRRRRFAWR